MKKNCLRCIFAINLLVCGKLPLPAQCTQNLLTNPSFESPAKSLLGNNLTGSFTFNGWTVTGNYFNIIRQMGSSYVSGPDNAKEGVQYADITSAGGTIYQDFTITGSPSSSPFVFGGYFSSRENQNYINWTARIYILKLPSKYIVSTSTIRAFTSADGDNPQQETWHLIYGFASLMDGNYRFLVNMGDYGNFDAAFVGSDCILPLRLNSFSGEYVDNIVKLNWKKDYQSGFSHFEVEKSLDGNMFTSIGKVMPSTNSSYSFNDLHITEGSTLYYRLKLVDINEMITYSTIIRVHSGDMFNVQAGPNPASDHVSISGMKNHGSVRIIDLSGKTVFKKEVHSPAISIDVSFLQKGIYLLEYFNGIQKQARKLVKQ